MSKVKQHVKVTITVLGKEFTLAEAETLYLELGVALNKSATTIHYPYPIPVPQTPWPRTSNFWYGTPNNVDCASDSIYTLKSGAVRGD